MYKTSLTMMIQNNVQLGAITDDEMNDDYNLLLLDGYLTVCV